MGQDAGLRCPVCRAAFRGVRVCSRCGADLYRLMLLAHQAYLNRQAARQALLRGDFSRAHALAHTAQELCGAPQGRRLELLAAWLDAASAKAPS